MGSKLLWCFISLYTFININFVILKAWLSPHQLPFLHQVLLVWFSNKFVNIDHLAAGCQPGSWFIHTKSICICFSSFQDDQVCVYKCAKWNTKSYELHCHIVKTLSILLYPLQGHFWMTKIHFWAKKWKVITFLIP